MNEQTRNRTIKRDLAGKKRKIAFLLLTTAVFILVYRALYLLPDNLLQTVQKLAAHSFWFLLFFGYVFLHMIREYLPKLTRSAAHIQGGMEVGIKSSERPAEYNLLVIEDKYRFIDKIPEYKAMLEKWMATEKPYTNKDFKLMDVMQALPLNRSYLSRMFDEAYNETFFSFVMRYRLEESLRLLETRQDLTVARIAQACGFSSPSVFGRAFLRHKGTTPKEYRNNFMKMRKVECSA